MTRAHNYEGIELTQNSFFITLYVHFNSERASIQLNFQKYQKYFPSTGLGMSCRDSDLI